MASRTVPNRQPFSRLPVPQDHAAMGGIVNDIYDKISLLPQSLANQFQSQLDAFKASAGTSSGSVSGAASTSTSASSTSSSGSGSGSGSGSSVSDVTIIPRVIELPTTGTIDEVVILLNADGTETLYNWTPTGWQIVQSSAPITATPVYAVRGPHSDRIALGTGTVSGSTFTLISGPNFALYWAGSKIAINDVLYTIATVSSSTVLTVVGTPPSGTQSWQMEYYSAVNYPIGAILYELNREVMYVDSGAGGFGDVQSGGTIFNWTSGPLFSPYWAGTFVSINGGAIVKIVSCGRFSLVLASAQPVLTNVLWNIVTAATWYYAVGTMVGPTTSMPTDLDQYADANFEYHDTSRFMDFYGVRDTTLTGSAPLKFAYWHGVESLSFFQWSVKTFHPYDAGYQVYINDYGHTIEWTGSQWLWGPGDPGSGFIVFGGPGLGSGLPHPVTFWKLCDGSTVKVMTINGSGVPTELSVTTPNPGSDTFLRTGTYTGSVSSAGTTSVPTTGLTIQPNTTDHTHPISTTSIVQGSGTPIFVSSALNTSGESNAHTHAITGGVTVPAPTVSAGAPTSMAFQLYIRI